MAGVRKILVVLTVAALAVAGCSSDGGDEDVSASDSEESSDTTEESSDTTVADSGDFVEEVDALCAGFTTDVEAAGATLSSLEFPSADITSIDELQPLLDEVQVTLEDGLSELAAPFEEFSSDLDTLEPPSEVESSVDDAVAGIDQFVADLAAIEEAVADVDMTVTTEADGQRIEDELTQIAAGARSIEISPEAEEAFAAFADAGATSCGL